MGKPDCNKEPKARHLDEDPTCSIPTGPRPVSAAQRGLTYDRTDHTTPKILKGACTRGVSTYAARIQVGAHRLCRKLYDALIEIGLAARIARFAIAIWILISDFCAPKVRAVSLPPILDFTRPIAVSPSDRSP